MVGEFATGAVKRKERTILEKGMPSEMQMSISRAEFLVRDNTIDIYIAHFPQ